MGVTISHPLILAVVKILFRQGKVLLIPKMPHVDSIGCHCAYYVCLFTCMDEEMLSRSLRISCKDLVPKILRSVVCANSLVE